MPIRKDLRHFYRGQWKTIRQRILKRERYCCKNCGVPNYSEVVGSKGRLVTIILTVAHLDHNPANNSGKNLAALCQRCHLAHDRAHHMANARRTRYLRKHRDQRPLPFSSEGFIHVLS